MAQRSKFTRDDFLHTFCLHYNKQSAELDVTPPFITQEIEQKSLISNMFSSYVVRPKHFDPDPLGLPKKY